MRERPILFSAPMVRAILDGSKTQTRRVVKLPIIDWIGCEIAATEAEPEHCPYGQPGDRLWVKESTAYFRDYPGPQLTGRSKILQAVRGDGVEIKYRADGELENVKWRAARFMFKWASRITLEVTDVRVERLQDISLLDVYAEGCERPKGPMLGSDVTLLQGARNRFRELWDSSNADKHPWSSNPWVWAVTFRRCD